MPAARCHVCLIRLGAMGDIIHTLPLAADLTAAGHRLTWLCEDRWQVLLDGNPAVDAIITVPRRRWQREQVPWPQQWREYHSLIRALQRQRFDWVIDAQSLLKSAIPCLFSGCRQRIGHARPRAREGAWLAHRYHCPVVAEHVIDQQRALGLPILGRADGDWRFPLPAWHEEQQRMDQWLADQGLAQPWGLNVGAGWPTKVWPEARLVACCQLLADAGQAALLLWGSPAEGELARRIQRQVPQTRLAPPTSIPELAALLHRCRVLISGDTGPLHLARALGTPALGLFGPVPAGRNGVRGPRWSNLQAPGKAWERRDARLVDMGAITAEQVWTTARKLVE